MSTPSTLSREAMMELMAYADGELDDASAEIRGRVEELVKTSDEARRVVDAMRSLGDVVRELPEAQGPVSAVADSIADGVMAKLADEPVVPVISLASRRKIGRAHYAAAAVAALALAAGVAVYMKSNQALPGPVASDEPHESTPVIQPAPGATDTPPSPAASLAQNDPQAADKNDDVDLEEVESADHNLSVFYVPKSIKGAAAHAGASVVVWIDDHGGH